MTDPKDSTLPPPAPGLLEDEPATSPDLAVGLRCPQCSGEGYELTVIEHDAEGRPAKWMGGPCSLCKGSRVIDREAYRMWFDAHPTGRT
jgi:hypothetical protein